MLTPGASKSVILFLLYVIALFLSTAPTEVAFLMHAGEDIAVVLPSFPAAIVTEIFFAIAPSIASAVAV